MANLNKVLLIGRLTRDPEIRTFANGGKVAHFGFAVNNRKMNSQTGQWEDDPVFLEVDAFNRQTGRSLADLVEQSLRKGNQVFIEGHLKLDQWTSQDGQKRSKVGIVVDNLQFLERREPSEGGGGGYRSAPPRQASGSSPPSYEHEPPMDRPPETGGEGEIPF